MCNEAYLKHVNDEYKSYSHCCFNYILNMFSKVKVIINSLRLGHSSHAASTPLTNEQHSISLKPIEESIIITEQRTKSNEEDVTIVWFAKDAKITREQSFIGSLRTVNDYIQVRLIYESVFVLIDYFRFLTMKKLLWDILHQSPKKKSY